MKQRSGLKWLLTVLCAGAVALGSLGCAEEVGDIDRTQTNKLEKRLLAGHWYYLQTVIDAPQTTAQAFNGLTNFGNNPKVMFEITEKFVYVVPVTENVQFAEAPYTKKKVRNYWDEGKSHEFIEVHLGQPISAFPVVSHFDVQRNYNAATGKQGNVLEENTTDKVWHERKYIRIDWGGNAILDWAFATGTQQFQPGLDHYVQEGEDQYLKPAGAGANPDLPEFKDDYISFVTKAYIPPSGADWQGYACSPFTISNKDCAGTVVKVRHSFRKAPVFNDYETFVYTNGEHMDKFGLFLSTRFSYDEYWNLTESARDYKAQRWNLWQKTYSTVEMLDADDKAILCNTDLDCPGDEQVLDYSSNRCKKDDVYKMGTCVTATLIPHKERGLNPVLYHISAGHDGTGCTEGQPCMWDQLKMVWYQTADDWSLTFRETVAWLYALEDNGQYWTTACKTDTDCTAGRDDVLAEALVAMPRTIPLHPEEGCTDGSVAIGMGDNNPLGTHCVSSIGCDEANPCAIGTFCKSGSCHEKLTDSDNNEVEAQVLVPKTRPGVKAATMVVYPMGGGYGIIPVRDDFFGEAGDPKTNIQLDNTTALIRFVNATPDSTATLEGVSAATKYVAAPTTPNAAPEKWSDGWVRQAYKVPAGDRKFTVSSDKGSADTSISLKGGYVYIAAFVNGDTLVIAGSPFSSSAAGVRIMHAIPAMGPIDGGVTSVRTDAYTTRVLGGQEEVTVLRGEGVKFFKASPTSPETGGAEVGLSTYVGHRFDNERIVALKAGADGAVTCMYTLHEGRCAGWAGDSNPVDTASAQYMTELPAMFLICENTYDKATELAKYDDATATLAAAKQAYASAKAAYDAEPEGAKTLAMPNQHKMMMAAFESIHHDGRYSTKGTNPYAPIGAQQLENAEEIFNPCERFVKEPYSLKKIGDVRYNFMYWVGENQASSPLGYGPSGGDPETGQLVWGNAYIYGAPILTYGQYATDLVDLINGELKTEDIITGAYVKNFVQAKGDPIPYDNSGSLYTGGLDNFDVLSAKDKKAIFRTHGQFDDHGRVKGIVSDPLAKNIELWEFMNNDTFRKSLFQQLPTVPATYAQDRLDRLRGTYVEDLMINEEVKNAFAASADPNSPVQMTEQLRDSLSPANWATGSAFRKEDRHRHQVMSNAPCTYDREFLDDNIYGLAKEHFCTSDEQTQFNADPTSLNGKTCRSGDDLRWELTRRIFNGVLLHEVGHTVSLRHNFGGSVDLFNFFDEYYDIREKENVLCQADAHCDEDLFTTLGDGTEVSEICDTDIQCGSVDDCPGRLLCTQGTCTDSGGEMWGACSVNNQWVSKFVPRSTQTPNEAAQKISEYQYSTIMDYGGRFNSDIHGLGKYDRAAIKFGYGKLLEVYKDPSKIRDRINGLAKRYSREPSYFAGALSTGNWRFAGTIFHGFNYLENYIGVEQNLQRTTVAYEAVKLERNMNTTYEDDRIHWTRIEVPYRFCSDEFRGNMGCYTWDTGIDIGEIIENGMILLDEYYVFDAFMRDRMFSGTRLVSSYYSRVMSRYMAMMGDAGRYFAIYDNIFNDYPWYEDHKKNVYGMHVLATSAETAFNNLAGMLAQPAPGAFEARLEGDCDDPNGPDCRTVYRNMNYDLNDPNADLTIPIGVGKFPYTQYRSPDQYGFQNHVLWVGSFWLKLAALMTLTDSTFYSSADWVGEQLEIGRSTAVGFNTLYQTEMNNLLGGITANSYDQYSGVAAVDQLTGESYFKGRDLFNPDVDKDRTVIEPGLSNLSMRLWASAMGIANLPAGFDPSFIDAMTVFLEGSGYEFDLNTSGAGVQIAKFADPFGQKTYVAYTPNYEKGRFAPAYHIVSEAEKLRGQWENATGAYKAQLATQLKERIQMLDVLRELHTSFGGLVY